MTVEHQHQSPGSSKLLLVNAKPEDSAYYNCEAHNSVKLPITRTIYINVLGEYVKEYFSNRKF